VAKVRDALLHAIHGCVVIQIRHPDSLSQIPSSAAGSRRGLMAAPLSQHINCDEVLVF
jgi:hypothetical protein